MSENSTSKTDTFAERASLTPRQIVAALDKYIIGQEDAKKSVAIALRNRWRRQNAPEEMAAEIMPNNIIMIGPTGVGKTEIARRLAKLARAPFIKVEATKFTEVGYVGRDVESMIRDLVEFGINMVREERTAEVEEKGRKLAEDRILDILVPPTGASANANAIPGPGFTMKVDEPTDPETDLRNRTREKFRKKLQNGELDEREIEIEVSPDASPMLQVLGPMGMEDMGINFQEMLGNIGGKKPKKRRLPVGEAKEVLAKEEAGKLVDMDAVTKDALVRVQDSGIVFIDEIDKVASSDRKGPDVSREGVQRDLLPIVEGSTVNTKYGIVKTDHILFIASGAFHVSKPSDLVPELQGRFPIRVELKSLDEEDFYKILTIPENALLKQYQALLASEGVTLVFEDEAIREIAHLAAEVNEEVENIGARRLHTILTSLLEELLYNVPDGDVEDSVTIGVDQVREKLSEIVKNRDLSQYIL